MADAGADVVGVDWRLPLAEASRRIGPSHAVQGNLDPALLGVRGRCSRSGCAKIRSGAAAPGHIFNLGHGVPPDADPGVLARIVDLVHAEGPAPRRSARGRFGGVMARVVVVGGGISGLVAARKLVHSGLDVTIAERGSAGAARSPRPCWMASGWTPVLRLLARRPEAVALIDSLRLSDRRVHPSDAKPDLLVGGRLHPMPRSVSGVPTDLDQLSGLLSAEGLAGRERNPRTPPARPVTWRSGRWSTSALGPR